MVKGNVLTATIKCPKHGWTNIRVSGAFLKCSKCYLI
jgi:hypothetical protein